MHLKIPAAIAMCICLFLTACDGSGSNADSQRFDIAIPSENFASRQGRSIHVAAESAAVFH